MYVLVAHCNAMQCRLQTGKQTLPDRSHDGPFYGIGLFNSSTFQYSLFR